MVRKDKKVLFSHNCIWGLPKAPLLRANQGRNQLLKKYHKRWDPDAAFQGGKGDSDSFCPDYVSHAPGKPSHQELINISDTSQSKQNLKIRSTTVPWASSFFRRRLSVLFNSSVILTLGGRPRPRFTLGISLVLAFSVFRGRPRFPVIA